MMNTTALPQSRTRYQDPRGSNNNNNMLYNNNNKHVFQTGSRLLTGYNLPQEHMSHLHNGYQQHQQFHRHFAPQYDGQPNSRPHYTQQQQHERMNGWTPDPVYTNVPAYHQSFCGQSNNESRVLHQQTDQQCAWTVRNPTIRSSDTTSSGQIPIMQKQSEPYHQLSHTSTDRDTYILHPPSSVTQCDTTKRRVSLDNSSPLYDHIPATPYSSEPPTPSYHPSSYLSSSTYLAPSPSSILMTSDPFSGTRSSIPIEHYPPTPYSDELHSPNSEHSGYASPQVTSSFEIPNESENGQLSCLEGYDSQRNGSGQDQQLDHSSSFGAREQNDYYEEEGGNIYSDIPLHDLIGTVSNQTTENQFLEDRRAVEESSTTKNESRKEVQVTWEGEEAFLHRTDDVTTTKKCKSSSAYLPSATARRAEEMLSSLGESIEPCSSKKVEVPEKVEAQKDILKVGESRKRKLNDDNFPKYDLADLSSVLGEVSLELNGIPGQGNPGYPLNSIFCVPAKMIRLQFDANDGETNVDTSSQNVELSSPKSARSHSHQHPLLFLDIDKITRVAASQVNDSQESKQQTDSDENKSSNANRQTDRQTKHVHNPNSNVIQTETETEIEHRHTDSKSRDIERDSSNEISCDVKESVGGPNCLEVSSDFVRGQTERRLNRRHCRHRCSKRHKRKKRKQFHAEDSSNYAKNQMNEENLENVLVFEIQRHLTKYFMSPNERSVFSKVLTFHNGQKLNVNLILSMTNNSGHHHQQSKVIPSKSHQLYSKEEKIPKMDWNIKCENKKSCAISLSKVSALKGNDRERDNTNNGQAQTDKHRSDTNTTIKENTNRAMTNAEKEFSDKRGMHSNANGERERVHTDRGVENKDRNVVKSHSDMNEIISFDAGATTQQSPLSTMDKNPLFSAVDKAKEKHFLSSLQSRDKNDKEGQHYKTSTHFDRVTKMTNKVENAPTFSCGQCSEVFNLSSEADIDKVCSHVAVGVLGSLAKSFSAFFRYFRFRVKLLVKPVGGQVYRQDISAETVVACAQCKNVEFRLSDKIGTSIVNHLEECGQKNEIKFLPNSCIICDCRVQNYRQHFTDYKEVHLKRIQAMSTFGCVRQTVCQKMSKCCKVCGKSCQNSDPRLPSWLSATTCDDCILSTAQNIDKKSVKTQVIFCNFCRQGKYGIVDISSSICVDCFDIFDAFKTLKNGEECVNYVKGMLNELVTKLKAGTALSALQQQQQQQQKQHRQQTQQLPASLPQKQQVQIQQCPQNQKPIPQKEQLQFTPPTQHRHQKQHQVKQEQRQTQEQPQQVSPVQAYVKKIAVVTPEPRQLAKRLKIFCDISKGDISSKFDSHQNSFSTNDILLEKSKSFCDNGANELCNIFS